MIKNKVYRLTKDVEVAKDMPLKAGQEIEAVQGVIYINGYPVPPQFQDLFINWLESNPTLFQDDTRNW